jgi:pilus assembly protein Flp/PilA
MKALLVRFASDETAATATEYGLLVTGIGLAIISIVAQVGTQLAALLDRVVMQLSGG